MNLFVIILAVWAGLSIALGVVWSALKRKRRERDELLKDYLSTFYAQHPERDPEQVSYPPLGARDAERQPQGEGRRPASPPC